MGGKGSVGGKGTVGGKNVGGKNVGGKAAGKGSPQSRKGAVHLVLDRRIAQDLHYALTLALGGTASGKKAKPKPK